MTSPPQVSGQPGTPPAPYPSQRLGQAKILGGVGSILMLLGVLPYAGAVLVIVGLVLILVALKYVSEETGEPRIFWNALYSVIAGIVGSVLVIVFGISAIFSVFSAVPAPPPAFPPFHPKDFAGAFLVFLLVIAVIAWAVLLISAIFLMKSYKLVADKIGVGLFSTAGLLYLIGAALTIVVVGLIILFVAAIVQAVAFFSIPEALQRPRGQLV